MKSRREKMIDELGWRYGYEDEKVIEFARMCETYPKDRKHNKLLKEFYQNARNEFFEMCMALDD